MRALLLSDLALALPHMIDERSEELARTLCGQLYLPHLVAQLRAIEALPLPASVVGRPLAEALVETEVWHETLDILTDLRIALADELSADPEALARADASLFGFIDQLEAEREASMRRRARPTTMVAPASLIDPVPDTRP